MSIEELKKINFEYKDKINIPEIQNKPISHGVEIEFAQAEYNKVKTDLEKLFQYDPRKRFEKLRTEDYSIWKLKNDGSVQIPNSKDIFTKLGGEITTPIMNNRIKDWKELKMVCDMLKQSENIKINGRCSAHIHTDRNIYKNLKEYKNLLKLWMVYEDIIYRFSYGETASPRELTTKYAKPLSYLVHEILTPLEKVETEQELIKLIRIVGIERKMGLNLTNLTDIYKKKDTIEVRTYNGTINEKIIQNNILFNENLLYYATEEKFDEEFIEHRIKNYTTIHLNESIKIKQKKAQELANLIYNDEKDKIYFYKQYYKAYNENDIEKKYHM